MTFSAELFDNAPEQYEGPILADAVSRVLALNAALAVALVLVLLVMFAAELSQGRARRDDAGRLITLHVLGALSVGCVLISIYGLWLFHLGSLEAGVPTLETNHPQNWLTVRYTLLFSTAGLGLVTLLAFVHRGVGPRQALGHMAPTVALVLASGVAGFLPHAQREIAALILAVLVVISVTGTLKALSVPAEPEKQLAA